MAKRRFTWYGFISKGIILSLILGMFYVLFVYGYTGNRHKESVTRSLVDCVQSICRESTTNGNSCVYQDPRVSEILFIADKDNPDIKSILVKPSGDRCQ